jgi:hypothetical protein
MKIQGMAMEATGLAGMRRRKPEKWRAPDLIIL